MKLSTMKDWFVTPSAVRTAPTGFRSAAKTHIGLVRSVNEDRLLDRPDCGLWAVADGMGGHQGGDVAATLAVRALDDMANAGKLTADDVASALADVNRRIIEQFSGNGSSGCTVAGILAGAGGATVFWIGDSRVYRYRAGTLDLLTHDHSLVQEFVDAKVLTPDQARRHPQANVVTRALGASSVAQLDFVKIEMLPGDRFLICTDGLWGVIADLPLAAAIFGEANAIVERLTEAALQAGGVDNMAMILIDEASKEPVGRA